MTRHITLRTALAIMFTVALVVDANAQGTVAARGLDERAGVIRIDDGVNLFDAIYFGTGPEAGRLPSRGDLASEIGDSTAVIAAIGVADPTFFSRFGADIRTGDRVAIRGALAEGRGKLLALAQASPVGTAAPGCDGGLIVGDIWILFVILPFPPVLWYDPNLERSCDEQLTFIDRAVLLDRGGHLANDAFVDAIAKAFAT